MTAVWRWVRPGLKFKGRCYTIWAGDSSADGEGEYCCPFCAEDGRNSLIPQIRAEFSISALVENPSQSICISLRLCDNSPYPFRFSVSYRSSKVANLHGELVGRMTFLSTLKSLSRLENWVGKMARKRRRNLLCL